MDIRKIKKLIELIKETGVGEIEVTSGEESVRISRILNQTTTSIAATPVNTTPIVEQPINPIAKEKAQQSKKTQEDIEGHRLKAPMVGTVYLAPTPGAKPFVEVGQSVSIGDTLCLIEAMKMFNKIEADKPGVVSARLVENAQPVEYDQPLFIIETGE